MDNPIGKWFNEAYIKAKSTAENVSHMLSEGASLSKSAFIRSISGLRSAKELESVLLEYSLMGELLVETLNSWVHQLRNVDVVYYYDNDESPCTFMQVFLRCVALENVIRTFVMTRYEKKNVYSQENIEDIRNSLQQLFSYCLVVNVNTRRDTINLIFDFEPVDDLHLETLVQLVSILKYNWKNDVLFDERRKIANDILFLTNKKEGLEEINTQSGNAFEMLDVLRNLFALHKKALSNLIDAEEHCINSKIDIQSKISSFSNVLEACRTECEAAIKRLPETPNSQLALNEETNTINRHITECDHKIESIVTQIELLEQKRDTLRAQLYAVENEITMHQEMLNIKQQERHSAAEQLDLSNMYYKRSIEMETSSRNMYLRKINDSKQILSMCQDSCVQIMDLLSSMQYEITNKLSKIKITLCNVANEQAKFERLKLESHLKYMNKLTIQLETIRPTEHTKYANSTIIHSELEEKIRNEFHAGIIDLETIWSDFVEFYSDNKEYLDTDNTIFKSMHDTYMKGKESINCYI